MDDYLSEKEQLEQIREWWREYGWYLAGGVALGIAILVGMRQYEAYQQTRAETAATLFEELRSSISDDADAEALQLLARLREEFPNSAYTDQAGLSIVIMHLSNQSTRQAIDAMRYVMDNTRDEHLAMVARIRLARLLASAQRYDEALTLLDSVEPGSFAARFSEIRGDIFFAQGDADNARLAYLQALNGEESGLVERGFVQMKLDDLPISDEPVLIEEAPAEDASE